MEEKTGKSEVAADLEIQDGHDFKTDSNAINASGHVQELERNFNFLNMCAIAIVVGNCWSITGATIHLAIYNGGPPGFIYEFIVAGILYLFITASLGELASAIPTAGGVYHFASVTPGRKFGRVLGFFAGWWNSLAYTFGACSLAAISAEGILELYAITHEGFEAENWHIFICYLVIIWLCCLTLLFGNKFLPMINNVFMCLVIGGFIVTIIVVGVMAGQTPRSHASSSFVWRDWQNLTGYKSNGLVFVLGMLNGSFAIGTPDCATHMAEETPRPEKHVPWAMHIQMVSSFISTLIYLIILFYAINSWDDLLSSESSFLLVEMYRQATGTKAGAIGLSLIVILPVIGSAMGSMLTASRVFWSLARDKAVPFHTTFAHVSTRWKNPFAAVLFMGGFATVMGCIHLGSAIAFEAFVGSFVVLTTLSYLAAIVPFLLSKRKSVPRGPFFIPGVAGFVVNFIACAFMAVWIVFYCFPYSVPTSAAAMNYSSLIAGGLTIMIGIIWFLVRSGYEAPPVLLKEN